MFQKVKDYIQKMHMIQPGDKVYSALSGGADSVCLFFVLLELRTTLGFSLEAIHVEHGIRGEESKRDEDFVKELCDRNQILLHTICVDAPSYAKERGLGLEEAARILRYESFEKVASKGEKVAIAHHADDQAETILFQMIRGAGLTGMRGLLGVRQSRGRTYIRPLLCCSREEIEGWLQTRSISYCTDSTNACDDYSRNRIRHQVIPVLKQVNERAVSHMTVMAEQVAEVCEYLDHMTEKAKRDCVSGTEERRICLSKLQKLPPFLQKEIILSCMEDVCGKRKDLTSAHVEAVWKLCNLQSGKGVHLPYGMEAAREFDVLRVFLKDNTPKQKEIEIPCLKPGETLEIPLWQGYGSLRFEVRPFDGCMDKIPVNPCTKWMDYGNIRDTLFVRNRREKDYLTVDVEGHHKKLKEYFIEQKVPLSQRDETPLVTMGQEVLWVISGRTGESCRVRKETEYILIITYNGGMENDGYNKA